MIKNQKVVFATLDILPQVAPLAGGYLQAYACADPEIRDAWRFEQYVNMPGRLTPAQLTAALLESGAGVYAFSCYAWNMGLFKAVIPELLDARPEAHVILGGPQVMNYAHKYLDPARENLVLCNGEGEKTFRSYLKELSGESPDFSRVKGLSFYRDGELITTEAEPRIKNLDEIPSPILQGLFDPSAYNNIFIETNRGCPFTCFYCYWGGAIGAKVNKFSEERIRAEIEWVARNNIYSLAIVDANWGILERDVEFSRHIVECKDKYGAPRMVGFSGSKNTPERVAEITKIFNDAGLLLNHTISLQTMQEMTLRKVGRQNIKTEAYMSMQKYLNANGIGSHVELIWPLPGETLDTFRDGVNQLCAAAADMFFCHPLYLINNIELNNRREAYGIVSEESNANGSESEIVVETKEVSYDDYVEGWRFMFATIILYNLRSAYCLSKHLHATGRESFSGLYSSFARFLKANPELPLARLVEEAVAARSVDASTLGRIGYYMHASRDEFDRLLTQFVSSQPWWHDETAQLCFEVDLLNRPHLYAPGIKESPSPLRHLDVLELTPGGYVVNLPEQFLPSVKSLLGPKASFQANPVVINHRQNQFTCDPSSEAELHWVFCYHSAFSIVQISPTWESSEISAKAA